MWPPLGCNAGVRPHRTVRSACHVNPGPSVAASACQNLSDGCLQLPVLALIFQVLFKRFGKGVGAVTFGVEEQVFGLGRVKHGLD